MQETGHFPVSGPPPADYLGETLKKTPLEVTAEHIAGQGTEAFRKWWKDLGDGVKRDQLRPFLRRYEGLAQEADDAR